MRTCRTDPKVISAFAVTFGIGDQAVYQLENVFLCTDIGERVVVHGLFEVDGVEEFDSILLLLQQFTAFYENAAFRVLSIRIEKKVNYFYEVTTSD